MLPSTTSHDPHEEAGSPTTYSNSGRPKSVQGRVGPIAGVNHSVHTHPRAGEGTVLPGLQHPPPLAGALGGPRVRGRAKRSVPPWVRCRGQGAEPLQAAAAAVRPLSPRALPPRADLARTGPRTWAGRGRQNPQSQAGRPPRFPLRPAPEFGSAGSRPRPPAPSERSGQTKQAPPAGPPTGQRRGSRRGRARTWGAVLVPRGRSAGGRGSASDNEGDRARRSSGGFALHSPGRGCGGCGGGGDGGGGGSARLGRGS